MTSLAPWAGHKKAMKKAGEPWAAVRNVRNSGDSAKEVRVALSNTAAEVGNATPGV